MSSNNDANSSSVGSMPVDPQQFNEHIPKWVKALIGSMAAFMLIPSFAFILVVNFAGIREPLVNWLENSLTINQKVAESNILLVKQLQTVEATLTAYTGLTNQRLSTVEETVTVQGKAIKKLEGWASDHSSNLKKDFK